MVMSASTDTVFNFLNVFEHQRTVADDARIFFNRLAYDDWNLESVDIFLNLVSDPSGSAIVTLLSDSHGTRESALALDPCTPTNCETIQTLQLLTNDKVQDAWALLESIFGT